MKIIEPKVELWEQGNDPVSHVAKCARVCYGKTEGKSTDQQLYDNLRKAKHNSMFRHESVYAIVPAKPYDNDMVISYYLKCPYLQMARSKGQYYITTNMNFIIDHSNEFGAADDISHLLLGYRKTPAEFCQYETGWNMMRYTFHITTQISTSRELNRVSPNAIAERSTRYIDNSNGVIVRPHWISKQIADAWNENILTRSTPEAAYLSTCDYAFRDYEFLIANGIKREDARGVLPLDTATEVVYTYSVDEWKRIIALRSDKKAHPNAQIIANMIKEQLEQLGYSF